ncbi:MAG: pentapeptide repeat-containing protein [Chromatiales bacterium]
MRRGDTVLGLFPTSLIKRYLILGRIRQTDELSLDREAWHPVSKYPMFAPNRLAEDSAMVLAREDERKPGDRRANEPPNNPYKERRSGVDRRAEESSETIERRKRRVRIVASLKPTRQSNRIPATIAVILLAGIVLGGFLFKPDGPISEPVCVAPPTPGVNWSNCRKEQVDLSGVDLRNAVLRNSRLTGTRLTGANLAGSDLAYADLVGAALSNSQLQGANALGAILRKADLRNANLERADLSYVDLTDATLDGALLTNAKLGNAIWIACAPGSLGTCVPRQ